MSSTLTDPVPPALQVLLARRSVSVPGAPGPSAGELDLILQAATTVPDHGALRPWRFVVIEGDGRDRFADGLAASALEGRPDLPVELIEKVRKKAFVAPCLIAVIASPVEGGKVPVWEQVASASCTGYAMALAAYSLGLAAMWKSTNWGDGAGLREVLAMAPSEQLLGWVNVGTPSDDGPGERVPVHVDRFATVLGADGTRRTRPERPPAPTGSAEPRSQPDGAEVMRARDRGSALLVPHAGRLRRTGDVTETSTQAKAAGRCCSRWRRLSS
jgi:nitroreductase